MALRTFNWVSSTDKANEAILNDLDKKMNHYYSSVDTRTRYNDTLLNGNDDEINTDEVSLAFQKWFSNHHFKNVVEIGCGTGRIRKILDKISYAGSYTGTELSKDVLTANQIKWPQDEWYFGSVYDLPFDKASFDLCFSFYVLEHLIYPKKALEKMYSLLKPGGTLLLVFPDFVATGMMPSQHLGFGFERSAMIKIRQFKIVDGLLSLYDSRYKLKYHLKNLLKKAGEFIINANPECLNTNNHIWPDIDAVYIANKNEVIDWAQKKNMQVHLPYGKEDLFERHSFVVMIKQ